MWRSPTLPLLLALTQPLSAQDRDPPLLPPPDLRTPSQQIRSALRDLQRSPPPPDGCTRFLDLGDIPPSQREELYRVLNGHVNQVLSSSGLIQPLKIIPGTLGSLLRLDLTDYQAAHLEKTWELLGYPDPYYHRKYPAVYPVSRGVEPNVVRVAEQRELIRLTHSQVPIVKGHWFLFQTAAQLTKPGYYDFLDVRNIRDFERKVIGYDRKTVRAFGVEIRASVGRSGVLIPAAVRAIVREDAPKGGYWYSIDFKNFVLGRNPLETLGAVEQLADGFEGFGLRANNSWATYAANGKGDFVDIVPQDLANLRGSPSNDTSIRPNVGCLECHTQGGLQPITDFFRSGPPGQLYVTDYHGRRYSRKEIVTLRQQYGRKLEPLLDQDRKVYEGFCQEATGWTAREFAQKYADWWRRYELLEVDLDYAERSMGVPAEKIKKALERARAAGYGDPVLSVLLQEGRTLTRVQWEQKFHTAYDLYQQYGSN